MPHAVLPWHGAASTRGGRVVSTVTVVIGASVNWSKPTATPAAGHVGMVSNETGGGVLKRT